MDTTGWLRGNTHTHSTRSDGDASPANVCAWYAGQGYDFVALTDHNCYLSPAEAAGVAVPEGFVLIGGSELSYKSAQTNRPVDVCSLGGNGDDPPGGKVVMIDGGPSATAAAALAAARQAGGRAVVNHPCWRWALSADDLLAVDGDWLLEIFNPSSHCNTFPVAGVASPEDIWDALLSAGRRVWGVAADDAHRIADPPTPPRDIGGVAWIRVGADERSADAILAAMAAGRFYASTGVELEDWSPGPNEYALRVAAKDERACAVHFIGQGGRLLATVTGHQAAYRPAGDEGYIRARVEDTEGARCWTQPWFLPRG